MTGNTEIVLISIKHSTGLCQGSTTANSEQRSSAVIAKTRTATPLLDVSVMKLVSPPMVTVARITLSHVMTNSACAWRTLMVYKHSFFDKI